MSTDFQSIFNEAWKLRAQGQRAQVLSIANEYLPKAQEAGDKSAEALFLKLHAQLDSDKGELKKSLSYYKQMERIYIDLKDEIKQMHTLRHIGMLYQELGETECAEKCLNQVVDFKREDSDMEAANTFRLYAITMEASNQTEEAINYWRKAQDIYAAFGIQEGVDESDEHLNNLETV